MTAALIGSTGFIGEYLLALLLKDNYFDTVRILVRRPVEQKEPGLEIKLVDFNDAESFKLALEEVDTIFCCVGTTNKKVNGDKDMYRKVDYDIPIKAAKFGKDAGCEKFILVSSVGANSKSNNFYLKLKGEVEESMQTTGIHSIHILQPSILLGDRHEKRPGEMIGKITMKTFSFILVGNLRKYRPVHGLTVAKAMLNAAKSGSPGLHKYEYDGIKKLAGSD